MVFAVYSAFIAALSSVPPQLPPLSGGLPLGVSQQQCSLSRLASCVSLSRQTSVRASYKEEMENSELKFELESVYWEGFDFQHEFEVVSRLLNTNLTCVFPELSIN